MTDDAGMPLGERVRQLRKLRGFRSSKELADAMPGSRMTVAIIDNIETGRKTTLEVSQLFNLAKALRVPPVYLLAPIRTPDAPIDIPNLSDDFAGMTAIEFDSWLGSVDGGEYRPTTMEERNSIAELHALRSLRSLRVEITRLEAMLEIQDKGDDQRFARSLEERLRNAHTEAEHVVRLLQSAGWTNSYLEGTGD